MVVGNRAVANNLNELIEYFTLNPINDEGEFCEEAITQQAVVGGCRLFNCSPKQMVTSSSFLIYLFIYFWK